VSAVVVDVGKVLMDLHVERDRLRDQVCRLEAELHEAEARLFLAQSTAVSCAQTAASACERLRDQKDLVESCVEWVRCKRTDASVFRFAQRYVDALDKKVSA